MHEMVATCCFCRFGPRGPSRRVASGSSESIQAGLSKFWTFLDMSISIHINPSILYKKSSLNVIISFLQNPMLCPVSESYIHMLHLRMQ